MEAIREIVNDLNIPEKKKAFNERRNLMYDIRRSMSSLVAHNRMVALYAYNLGVIPYEEDEITRKKLLLANVMLLHQEPEVEAYDSLRKDLERVDNTAGEYYRSIQHDLREALLDLKLPEIYVYQGLLGIDNFVLCRHLIIPNTCQVIDNEKQVERIIYPKKEKETNSKLRSFYNKTSFRYLEAMTEDYSLALEGKDLGKIK